MRHLNLNQKRYTEYNIVLQKYFKELESISVLSPDEEVGLIRDYRKGNKASLDKLVTHNVRFVISVAKYYHNNDCIELNDLISEGNMGLLKAAKAWDETKGFKLISYAIWHIRAKIINFIKENKTNISVPINLVGKYTKVNDSYSSLCHSLSREPTIAEIKDYLAVRCMIKQKDISAVLSDDIKTVSLDEKMSIYLHAIQSCDYSNDDDCLILDYLSSDSSMYPTKELFLESLQGDLERCISILTRREKEVLVIFFGLDGNNFTSSLEDVSYKLDITRERVRVLKETAVRKMKHKKVACHLKKYLGDAII